MKKQTNKQTTGILVKESEPEHSWLVKVAAFCTCHLVSLGHTVFLIILTLDAMLLLCVTRYVLCQVQRKKENQN